MNAFEAAVKSQQTQVPSQIQGYAQSQQQNISNQGNVVKFTSNIPRTSSHFHFIIVSSTLHSSQTKKVFIETPQKHLKICTEQSEFVMNDLNDEKKPLKFQQRQERVSLEKSAGSSQAVPKSHRKCYKTTIEKWKPIGNDKIHCPRCKALKRPIVRTFTEQTTQSPLKTALLLTCWPLCAAPCIIPEPTHENLHCRVCNYEFGIYDHNQQKLIPSKSDFNAL